MMQKGNLDILTITKKEDILKKIKKLNKKLNSNDKKKWKRFWAYFMKVWIKGYDFEYWNISTILKKKINITNRTNNALENFNKQLNSYFINPHPNIFAFIKGIKKLLSDKVLIWKEIKQYK